MNEQQKTPIRIEMLYQMIGQREVEKQLMIEQIEQLKQKIESFKNNSEAIDGS